MKYKVTLTEKQLDLITHKPKCILFGTWLEALYNKCPECRHSIWEY